MNMKTKLTTILLCILYTTASFAQQYGWVPLPSPNASGLFRNIYVSGNEAWLLNNNAIYYSNNYPSTQFSLIFTPSNTLNAMYFTVQGGFKYGWAVGSSSLGARTTDGTTWTSMSLSGTSTYNCVSFPTTSLGFASGTDNRLHKTVNGGTNWTGGAVALSVSNVNTLFFVDSNTGYVGTSDPRLAKTTDGGETWVDDGDITNTITDIYFLDSTHGWAVGASDILYYNSGLWTQLNNPTGQSLYSVFFLNQNEGWIVGNGGTILHSTDGGASWSTQTSGTTALLRDVFFTSPTNGYAVGNNGTILHYTQLTGIENAEGRNGSSKLMQNYPNPFNSTTLLKYTLYQSGNVHLAVYNLQGKMVSLLVNEHQSTGEHSAMFDGSHLPSGVYYYQISIADKFETGKMMLVK
jgi:photosystem II stability/assembly factor-like uncharacterized protein